MNTVKKILSVILGIALLIVCLPDCVEMFAKASVSGDFKYEVYYKEWAMITGYTGSDKAVTIPETICGKPVRGIGKASFKGSEIEEVTLPSTAKCIYADAFNDCKNLRKINFNEGLQTIYNSFRNTNLTSVTFPKSLKTLGGAAFSGNDSLKRIIFDGTYSKQLSVTSVFKDGFGCKTAEITVNCMPSVEMDLLFSNNNYTLTENDGIYTYKFNDLPEREIKTSGNYKYSLDENGNAVIEKYLNVNSINITVPEFIDGHKVTEIGDYAFCSFVSDGEYWNDVVQQSDSYSFVNVTLPDTVEVIGKYAFAFNNRLVQIKLPDNVKKIGYCAFAECGSLKSVEIPQSLSVISDYIFVGCNIEQISLHDGVKAICQNAFNFSSINSSEFSLPDSIEFIGENAFGNNNFTKISLPENTKELDSAFCNSASLENVDFNENIESINGAFEGCTNLKSVYLPESLSELGADTFTDCVSLERVHISSNVYCVGENAFSGCEAITEFEWDAPVRNIEKNAFKGCSISSFDFSDTDCVPNGAFQNSGITSAKIGENRESFEYKQTVGNYGFFGCENLNKVAVGGNVNEISTKAFANCPNLETVVIADSVEKISPDAFENSENVTIVCTENSYAQTFAQDNGIRVTTLVIAPIPNQIYTGKQLRPDLEVSVSSEKLKNVIDYSVSYSNNVNVGTAKAVISGRGDYSMLISKAEFAVVARNIADVSVRHITTQEYSGTKCCPKLTIVYNGRGLVENKDYTVTYTNDLSQMKGVAKIKGIGNFYGTVEEEFKIKEAEEVPVANRILNAIWNFWKELFQKFINIFR